MGSLRGVFDKLRWRWRKKVRGGGRGRRCEGRVCCKCCVFQGYIIKKIEKRSKGDGTMEDVPIYQEFIPMLFKQYSEVPVETFPTFNQGK